MVGAKTTPVRQFAHLAWFFDNFGKNSQKPCPTVSKRSIIIAERFAPFFFCGERLQYRGVVGEAARPLDVRGQF